MGIIGRACMILGALILAFAGFQLWGTGLAEAQAQADLDQQFDARLADLDAARPLDAGSTTASSSTTGSAATTASGSTTESSTDQGADDQAVAGGPASTFPTSGDDGTASGDDGTVNDDGTVSSGNDGTSAGTANATPVGALTDEQQPGEGQAVGRIRIPAIGVEKTFVQGVSRDNLRLGPGHYPATPFPGQAGNAAIAGHRTTNGAPFFDLDKLVPGDEIEVETLQGTFHYRVEAHEADDGTQLGWFVVPPTGSWVLDDFGDNRLTLTACHPKYSAQQRIVVTALLVSTPASTGPEPTGSDTDQAAGTGREPTASTVTTVPPQPTTTVAADGGVEADNTDDQDFEDTLGWNLQYLPRTLAWALAAAVIASVATVAYRRSRRRPVRALVALGAVVLFLPVLFVCFTYLDRLIPAV